MPILDREHFKDTSERMPPYSKLIEAVEVLAKAIEDAKRISDNGGDEWDYIITEGYEKVWGPEKGGGDG